MNIRSLAAAIAIGFALGAAAPPAAAQKKKSCETERKACLKAAPKKDKAAKKACETKFKECKLAERCAKNPNDKKCKPLSP